MTETGEQTPTAHVCHCTAPYFNPRACDHCTNNPFRNQQQQQSYEPPYPQGWVCPKCGTANSPHQAVCAKCAGSEFINPITSEAKVVVR